MDRRTRLSARCGSGCPAAIVFGIGIACGSGVLPALGVERTCCRRSRTCSRRSGKASGAPARRLDHLQGGGSAASCSAARRVPLALVLARWRPLGNALMPYMIAANAVPDHRVRADHERVVRDRVAVVEGRDRRRALLLPGAREHAARASRPSARVARADALVRGAPARRLSRVRIPNSLPFVFSALKIASVLAMIGAVVGDYFGGSTEALGVQIVSASRSRSTRPPGRRSSSRACWASRSTRRSRSWSARSQLASVDRAGVE